MKRLTALALAILVACLVWAYLYGSSELDSLSLDYIKTRQHELLTFYAEHPGLTVCIYLTLYILITALAIPGAVPLTLAGGALFGFWLGSCLVSLASTTGATLSFLGARYLLRDYVQKRFARQLALVNAAIEKEGAYYLFTARLVPVFPFFLTNLLMGLTPLRTVTYLWVSMPGMLAGTMVYVNAGVELGRVERAADVLAPSLVLAFAAIGFVPLILKKLLDRVGAGRT